jgi:hypothetical protein
MRKCHEQHDRVSLEIATRIANDLAARPEWIAQARQNLERWIQLNADAPSLLRCYAEWSALLDQPVDVVIKQLTEDTEKGRRLRRNSPFAGALSPQEVWDIKRRMRDDSIAA